MDLIEITEKERLSREDAAARLRALADMLAKHNESSSTAAACTSRCTCPTRSTSSSRSRSTTTKRSSRSSSNGERTQ